MIIVFLKTIFSIKSTPYSINFDSKHTSTNSSFKKSNQIKTNNAKQPIIFLMLRDKN